MKRLFVIVVLVFISIFIWFSLKQSDMYKVQSGITRVSEELNPLSIEAMRQRSYPGSDIVIDQTLPDGVNYHQYIASYMSDGFKIYGLLTVPKANGPWPAIVFNHGYISPSTYVTTQRYEAYVDGFARNGYVVFKSDYRGNGKSQGTPDGAYYSPSYTVDVLNALASIKKYPGIDPQRIGMWGHSMGGNITLRSLVVNTSDIKVAVIWGGVVAPYSDLYKWHDPYDFVTPNEQTLRNKVRQNIVSSFGTPSPNSEFWRSIDPTNYLSDIKAPVQLDVGGNDKEVPVQFSINLRDSLQKDGKTVEYFEYPGADHNIAQSLPKALQNSVDFFDKYLK